MSQKWSASSYLRLKVSFDPKLDAEALKNLISEDRIKELSGIELFTELDDVIINDLLNRVAPVLEKHTDEINADTVAYIKNLYKDMKSTHIYEVSNNLSVNNDEGLIILDQYVDAEGEARAVLLEVKAYNNSELLESASFKSFLLSLEKFLLQYGLVLDECTTRYDFSSEIRH